MNANHSVTLCMTFLFVLTTWQAQGAIVFEDDFSQTLDKWVVNDLQFGAGDSSSIGIDSGRLLLNAPQGSSESYGKSWIEPNDPAFLAAWDQSLPYRVEFDFMIPNKDNHWFFVYADSRVHTTISWYDEFAYQYSTGTDDPIYIIDNLVCGQWYSIRYDVYPSAGHYDIYMNDSLKVAGAEFLDTPYGPFQIGNRTDHHHDYGFAYWDDFRLTANLPEPSSVVVWSSLGAIVFLAARARRRRHSRFGPWHPSRRHLNSCHPAYGAKNA